MQPRVLAQNDPKWNFTGDTRLLVCLRLKERSGSFASEQTFRDVSLISDAWGPSNANTSGNVSFSYKNDIIYKKVPVIGVKEGSTNYIAKLHGLARQLP